MASLPRILRFRRVPKIEAILSAVSRHFHGDDTIFVTATSVGGFPEENGSFKVPEPILVADHNGDDYDPNWVGYLGNAFAIASGASAGPNGPVGFTHWDVTSNGAGAIGSLNILALGGEGSTSATTLVMHDDGSNTMVYATSISDSRSTDWENLNNINLSDTSGFVTLTGAETDVQEQIDLAFFDGKGSSHKDPFQVFGGGGLLTSVIGPINVLGGSGNSMYDFSGLDSSGSDFLRIFTTSRFDGGHGTNGNSEIAFNNNVLTEDGAAGGGTTVVQLSNISILDDTGFPLFIGSLSSEGGSPWIAANELFGQGGTITATRSGSDSKIMPSLRRTPWCPLSALRLGERHSQCRVRLCTSKKQDATHWWWLCRPSQVAICLSGLMVAGWVLMLRSGFESTLFVCFRSTDQTNQYYASMRTARLLLIALWPVRSFSMRPAIYRQH